MSEYGSSRRLPRPPLSGRGSEDSTTARAELPSSATPPVGEDQTVISTVPPMLLPNVRFGLHPSELGEKLEGERLGHFELCEFIGGGGMGAVFRAIDTMLNRTVAVKVLSTEQAGDEETIRRFKNEAQSAARLDHENIARVYYVGEDRGVHYIVFEHIEGINIRDLVIQNGPLSLAEAVSYTLQIAEALGHASQRDVVHRDIKPSNVLATAGGRAKLVDMGLARLHQVEHTDNDLTASGVTLGTFDYISPEQARDPRTADVRSDLYSLGCTLYFMLTGRPPFPEGTVLQKLLKHQADDAPDVREFRPALPDEVSRIVSKLLAKSPESRYQTPAELIADLDAISDQMGLRPVGGSSLPSLAAPTDAAAAPSRVLPVLPWLIPALLLLVGVVALDRFWSQAAEPLNLPEIRRVEPPQVAEVEPEETPPLSATPPAVETDPMIRVSPAEPEPTEAVAPMSDAPAPMTTADKPPTPPSAAATPAVAPVASLVAGHPLTRRLLQAATGEALRPETLSGVAGPSEGGWGLGAAPAETPNRISGDDVLPPLAPTPPSGDGAESQRMGILVVTPDARQPSYMSLRAACAAAQSGDIIELKYNGPLVERPLLLANKRLTIRAAEGFEPQVLFRPGPEAIDPVEYPRSMLTVTGGELTVIGVPIELDLPRAAASERWALIETRGTQIVSLRRCVLTIRNAAERQAAYHPQVAFFEVTAAPGGDGMMNDGGAADDELVTVRLKDTIVRGEATLVHSTQLGTLDFTWENGLLAITEKLASFQSEPFGPTKRAAALFNLQHLTAVTRAGLLLVRNREDAPHPIDVKIKCADSILLADPTAALIEQDGVDRVDVFQSQFTWSGDRNFYEGFTTFWKIGGAIAPYEPVFLMLDDWRQFWEARLDGDENRPSQQAVGWARLPSPDQPLHGVLPADYALSDQLTANAPRGAASDGRDVGFRADLLPSELIDQP